MESLDTFLFIWEFVKKKKNQRIPTSNKISKIFQAVFKETLQEIPNKACQETSHKIYKEVFQEN